MAEEKEKGAKWWIRYVFVPIAVALIGGGGVCAIAVAVIPYIFPTPSPSQIINTPEVTVQSSTEVSQPIQVVQPTATQITQCDLLKSSLPQSENEVISKFGFPSGTTILFIYELCPSAANAFSFKTNPNVVIELKVPDGGCIDSWSGFTEYIGDVGTPIEDGHGGWRVYKGTVRAPEMTYRIAGCK